MMIVYCDCPCHKPDSAVLHCVPCCDICPTCGKGIEAGFKEHCELCQQTETSTKE